MLGSKEKIHFHQLPTWGGNSFSEVDIAIVAGFAPRSGR